MAYKTLLTILHDIDLVDWQFGQAASLARRLDAHLDLLCLGIDDVQMGYYFAGAESILQQASLDQARERADAVLTRAKDLAGVEDVRWSAQGVVTQLGVLGDVVANSARYADLVLLPKPYGDTESRELESILEAALFTGQSPVLVLPRIGLPKSFPSRSVIGWNNGNEALRAVRAALPALRMGEKTSVAIVDPPEQAPSEAGPGRSLLSLLDRHGVEAELSLLPKTQPRISDVLIQHARDINADMIVAGAYGHSRLREAILGGATRELLEKCPLPLLMAR